MIPRHRKWLALVVLSVCLIGGLIVVQNSPQHEPSYRGKTVKSWIQELPADTLSSSEDNALKALQALGADGTVYLAEALQNTAPVPNKAYQRFFDVLARKVQKRLAQPENNENRRCQAVYALYSMALSGDDAIPALERAVPALTEATKDADIAIRHPAIHTLGLIGRKNKSKTIVLALTEALNDPDLGVCTAAADWLGAIGIQAREALPSLTKKLQDPSPHAREWAAYAICRIGGPPEEPVRVLISLLKDDSRDIRWNTVSHLRDLGMIAKPAVPALIETLQDSDSSIQEMAGKALARIDPEAAAKLIQKQ